MSPMADSRNGSMKPPAAARSAGAYTIDVVNLGKRLKQFYAHWREHKSDLWNCSDAIIITTPPPSEDIRYLKSLALHVWLFGYEFPEVIMVFMNKKIHFLCSPKKAGVLENVRRSAKDAVDADVVIHIKQKNDDTAALIDVLLHAIHSQIESENFIVGQIQKEEPEGKLLKIWVEKLAVSNLQLSDVTNGFSELFAIKDISELRCLRIAAHLTSTVMKNFVVPKLEQIIDEGKKVSHLSLMEEIEKVIHDPVKLKVNLKADKVDICYPPIVQSGGKFDLKPNASSNDENLYYESANVIICALGARYGSYCSNIARSFLIDANDKQRKAYDVLLKAQNAAITALMPGNMLSCSYRAAVAVVEEEAPELLQHLSKTAGTGIGIKFRESGLTLNTRNGRLVCPDMVFNVSLGFQNLQSQTNNPKTEIFSLLLADTVIILRQKPPGVLTSVCSKAVKDVAYSFNEDDEELPKAKTEATNADAILPKASLRSDKHNLSMKEMRQHQEELVRMKIEETARRLASGGSASGKSRGPVKASNEMITYENASDIPFSKELIIQVDKKNGAVFFPIYGCMVPFHASAIKSVTSNQDDQKSTVRIIFKVPGTHFLPHDVNSLKHQGAIYLKEITFRSKDPKHSSEVVQSINSLMWQITSRELEIAARVAVVTQEKLLLAWRMKPITLLDLSIRPAFPGCGRKLAGALEAHINGFSYSTTKSDERVEIMYGNIKHAFFQPAEREMITLLHFRLHNHIMVGNKKTLDIRFHVEVMDAVQTLGGGRRSALDPDEIEEEQRERDRKNKINMDFQNFVNKVHDHWGQPQFRHLDLEFEQPFRELGFPGVRHNASSFIVPSSTCLVELIDTPPLVITLSEIEIVNLERVGLGQKSFDMAIVFKDFSKDVFRIDSIPSSSLDGVTEWLDATDIKYYESRLNLNWHPIFKTIIEDPEKFIEEGGWPFLNLEGRDSKSDASQESYQGYTPSEIEEESESEDEDSESESLVESEDGEVEEDDEDSEEDKGKTWEELEREATPADRERGDESDSEEERKWRKAKAFGKSRIPDRRDTKAVPPKRAKLR